MTDLPLSRPSARELELIESMLSALEQFRAANILKQRYYEGRARLHSLGISLPPSLTNINVVVGWPGTAVDVLEERLGFQGWVSASDADFGLEEVYSSNHLDAESSMLHLDALIYGIGFQTVGTGGDGEPDVLVTVQSPLTTTVLWDRRTRRVVAGLTAEYDKDKNVSVVTLYLPDQWIRAEYKNGVWRVKHRDEHNLNHTLMIPFRNKPWGARWSGRSEISNVIRSLTDSAVRTLAGSEVSREFFAAPQRWVMGARQEDFVDQNGNPVPAWESYLGRILALGRDEDGKLPEVGQFTASSPTPFFEQLRGVAQLFAAEAAIPASYLGYNTDSNPSSADAIRAGETRLIKRAERRQTQFGVSHLETAKVSFMVREGTSDIPSEFQTVTNAWMDAATPTKAASADAAVKLVSQGILPPDSSVTWELVGLTQSQQQRLEADWARRRQTEMLGLLTDGPATPAAESLATFAGSADLTPEELSGDEVKRRADALGVFIRSGVAPEDAARRVGLPGLEFTGGIPVSLRPPAAQADSLE